MENRFDDISFEINNSEKKLILFVGKFENFAAYNFANNYNYSFLEFDDFLKVNNISSIYFRGSDADRTLNINISIDSWTQKVAYAEQKTTIIINGYDVKKMPDLLTRSLLMQELLYLSKNSSKLKTNLVFFIDLINGSLEEQILSKIIPNCKIIELSQ